MYQFLRSFVLDGFHHAFAKEIFVPLTEQNKLFVYIRTRLSCLGKHIGIRLFRFFFIVL